MPPPNKLELPQFAPNTILLLEQKHESAIKAVLTESSVYYYTKYPGISSTDYYQAIGQKLVRKFPFLEHDGKNPWVSVFVLFVNAFSQCFFLFF